MQEAEQHQDALNKAFSLLEQWKLFEEADEIQPLGKAAVYKTSVVLLLMLYQRLNCKHSLQDAVEYFVKNAPIKESSNRRVREGSLSTKTGSYSVARNRLTLELVNWLQTRVSEMIIQSTPASFKSMRVFLLDGTTLSAAPNPALQKAFPPSSNQHGEGVWPIIHLVTAHELSSGAATTPEIGPMNGPNALSETRLADGLIARLPPSSIVMADAGFGIYHVAYGAYKHNHKFVFRLTVQRFESYAKKAKLICEKADSRVYSFAWAPSKKELANHPVLPANSRLEVKLYAIKMGDEWLYLVTDIEATVQELKSLYFHRYSIEVDIRNIKVVLQAEYFDCKSVEMLRKEIGMAMVAYNLTTQVRRQAAVEAKREPRELSFTGVWTVFRHQLLTSVFTNAEELETALNITIRRASQQTLPRRPGRSYPREVYKRRPKSSHFQTRKRRETPSENKAKE